MTGRPVSGGVAAAIVFALLAMPGLASAQMEDRVTTLDGVYTAEQAEAGRQIYTRVCSACHTLDWYTGDIVRAWAGGTVYGLFDVILNTMPQDNPSSLPRSDYLNVMAYILEVNGMPPGEEPLPRGRSGLSRIIFEFAKENR